MNSTLWLLCSIMYAIHTFVFYYKNSLFWKDGMESKPNKLDHSFLLFHGTVTVWFIVKLLTTLQLGNILKSLSILRRVKTKWVLASARQNSLNPQHKFWRAIASARCWTRLWSIYAETSRFQKMFQFLRNFNM